MLTENTCLAVVAALYENTDAVNGQPVQHSLPNAELYRKLLPQYSLATLDDTVRWLQLGDYVGGQSFGFPGVNVPHLLHLLPKGIAFAESRSLDLAERHLLYREEPYEVFVARQFSASDNSVWQRRNAALAQSGFSPTDGQVDGLDAFRGEIHSQDRTSPLVSMSAHPPRRTGGRRLRIQRVALSETGAAVALGKKPLLLVEMGMHDHYAGELQRTYEYIPFDRANFVDVLPLSRAPPADRPAGCQHTSARPPVTANPLQCTCVSLRLPHAAELKR